MFLIGSAVNAQFIVKHNGQFVVHYGNLVKSTGVPDYDSEEQGYIVDTTDYLTWVGESLGTWTAADGYSDIEDREWNGTTYRTLSIESHPLELYHGYGDVPILSDTSTEKYLRLVWEPGPGHNATGHGKLPGGFYGSVDAAHDCNTPGTKAWAIRAQRKQGTRLGTYMFPDAGGCPQGDDQDSIWLVPGTPYDIVYRLMTSSYSGGVSEDNSVYEVFVNGSVILQDSGFTTYDEESHVSEIAAFGLNAWSGGSNPEDYPQTTAYEYVGEVLAYDDVNSGLWGVRLLHDKDVELDYPELAKGASFYYDELINDDTNDLTTYNYPSASGNHINEIWLLDAGPGGTPQIDFNGTSATSSGDVLLFFDSDNNTALKPFHIITTATDLDATDHGFGATGRITSDTRFMLVVLMTDYAGGGQFNANITYN